MRQFWKLLGYSEKGVLSNHFAKKPGNLLENIAKIAELWIV